MKIIFNEKVKCWGLVVGAMCWVAAAQGAVIAHYDASATSKDPTDQGWAFSTTTGASPSAGQETIGGTTYDYWDISNPSPASTAFSAIYRQNLVAGNFTNTGGWTASVTSRIALAADTRNGAWFQVSDGQSSWEISFVTEGGTSINYISSAGLRVPISSFNISEDYFTMQMYYNPTDATVSYFLNGTQIGSAVARSAVPTATSGQLYMRWGDNSASAARTISHWNEVSFETGYTVIPEPGTMALLGVGVLGVAMMARRRLRA